MRKISSLVAFLLLTITAIHGQSLDFLGLTGVSYGMKIATLEGSQIIMDSTSSYTDTSLFIKNTRCLMYYRPNENLQLKGFTAKHIEYEFCDGELGYVFVYVSGKSEINKALAALKLKFRKLNCGKNVPLGSCTLMDTNNGQLRLIVRINQITNDMNLVLIPKKAAK